MFAIAGPDKPVHRSVMRRAAMQLGNEKIEVRLGGIYTLERISRESPDDYWVVMETLAAFVREHARWKERDKSASETLPPCSL